MIETTSTIDINGKQYRIERLPVMEQAVLFQQIVPLFGAFEGIKDLSNLSDTQAMAGLAKAIGEIPKERFRTLLEETLASVKRQGDHGTGWHPVMQGGQCAFPDIDLAIMGRLIGEVFKTNFSRFFASAVQQSQARQAQQADT